jgi:hypothetical protein
VTDSSAALWRVLGTLGDSPRKSGNGWEAKCPAHEDRHASLSVGIGLDGRVLLDCHAGCSTENVLVALGLGMADLFEHSAAGNVVRRFRLVDATGRTIAVHGREDLPGDKKLWWEANGKNGLNGTPVTSLPLYRLPDLLAANPATPVILTEGEKAADALVGLGLLAVATVTGAAAIPCDATLEVLNGHKVWVWPDNDDPGRKHMAGIAPRLKADVSWVVWPDAPAGGDAADYVAQGGTVEGIQAMLKEPDLPTQTSPSTQAVYIGDMAALQRKVLPEPRWSVPGIFPEGVVLLVGKSKLGKSWFALDVALAVSTGAKAWGGIQVEQGEVLYLALEDSERRLSDRMAQVYGDQVWPAAFLYAVKFPRANEGGLELVLEWLNNHPEARLVIIDVLGKFRPREANARRLYDMDYDAIAPIAELARQRGVCVLILHHANKLKPEDPIDSVSGTTGLAGAADAICIFRRERGKVDASLLITGRDVEEQELAFKFVLSGQCGHAWELIGDAAVLRMSAERQEILDVVTSQPSLTPSEIADAVGKPRGNVRYLLFRMVRDGQIRNHENRYFPPLFSNTANSANSPTAEIKNGVSPLADPLVRPPVVADSTVVTASGVVSVGAPGYVAQATANRGEVSAPTEDDGTLGVSRCRVCRSRLFPDEQEVCERCQ